MALIDVIKCDASEGVLVWKFPSSNLRMGSQLVVRPGQVAVFVYRGEVADYMTEGTYTLSTGNIPGLTRLISLPFGGETPFQAEVWFFNLTTNLETKWGTPAPIQVEDPAYGIVIPVRAFGQYGFRLSQPDAVLRRVVGSQTSLDSDAINRFMRGRLLAAIGTIIGTLFNEQVSFLNISSKLEDVSDQALIKIRPIFEEYGFTLENFFFSSISVPEDDSSYIRLKGIKEKAAELKVVGRDIYQFDRTTDVLKAAAENEGLAGSLVQTNVGAGLGLMLGVTQPPEFRP